MTNPADQPTLRARAATDGDRVQINRVIGSHPQDLDPFLLIDYSRLSTSDSSQDLPRYPAHPHRGLEIIQYLLEGELQHRDNLGNITQLQSGDLQWLSTASGMIHEEIPAAVNRVCCLSIWINMAAHNKEAPAQYRHIPASELPKICIDKVFYKALCGEWQLNGQTLRSPLTSVSADVGILHIELSGGAAINMRLHPGEQYFLYLFHGAVSGDDHTLNAQRGVLLRLSSDEPLTLAASELGASVLLMKGKRIAEPLVQYGPFAMNNQQQILQAMQDYRQIDINKQLPN